MNIKHCVLYKNVSEVCTFGGMQNDECLKVGVNDFASLVAGSARATTAERHDAIPQCTDIVFPWF